MASRGLRVLACAVKELQGQVRFLGLIGMEDPPRPGMLQALEEAKRAGIRTIMITGDHLETARAIGRKVGIGEKGMEGRELDSMSDEQLQKVLEHVSVFARVSPLHKLRILKALQANREVVAMTGDGVNDAPALKGAHVGIAMGKNGTEVAREAASIVLADDRYATIVNAIREGRHLYDNIRKFILFLMHTNFYELLFIATVLVLKLPLPYLPIHILWINLMTDGLPALALGMEGEESDIMRRPPRRRDDHLFRGQWGRLVLAAVVPFCFSFLLFLWLLSQGADLAFARTMTFTFAIFFELAFTFTIRSNRPFWETGLTGNRWLLAAVSVPVVLHMLLLYTPLAAVFSLTPIDIRGWMLIALLVLPAFFLFECLKTIPRTYLSPKRR